MLLLFERNGRWKATALLRAASATPASKDCLHLVHVQWAEGLCDEKVT